MTNKKAQWLVGQVCDSHRSGDVSYQDVGTIADRAHESGIVPAITEFEANPDVLCDADRRVIGRKAKSPRGEPGGLLLLDAPTHGISHE
jgi:hypothetical protein